MTTTTHVEPATTDAGPLALSVAQTATTLGVTTRTVERLIATKALPSFKVGRCRKVLAQDLHAFIAAQKRAAAR